MDDLDKDEQHRNVMDIKKATSLTGSSFKSICWNKVWWRRGGSNPRPQMVRLWLYMFRCFI